MARAGECTVDQSHCGMPKIALIENWLEIRGQLPWSLPFETRLDRIKVQLLNVGRREIKRGRVGMRETITEHPLLYANMMRIKLRRIIFLRLIPATLSVRDSPSHA